MDNTVPAPLSESCCLVGSGPCERRSLTDDTNKFPNFQQFLCFIHGVTPVLLQNPKGREAIAPT
jgi:hypothetical protein